MKNLIILSSIFLLLFTSCKTSKEVIKNDVEINNLYAMMQGSYDSSNQAAQDSTYYNISLEMHPVWQDSNEKWLYVEQALYSRKDKPYRVRMYKLHRIDKNTIASEVYTIPDEQRFYGKYKDPSAFLSLEPSDLEIREGCAVLLSKNGNNYTGATGINTCASSLRGAAYASSEVTMTPDRIVSWDRGYDTDGKQVWGAEKGGYVFIKK